MSVLIAEDNKISALTLKIYLQKCKYPHFFAENGTQAYEIWEREHPRIVITDLEMPGMSGIELIRKIRQNETHQYTHIIVITAHTDDDSFAESVEAGADDYIHKPITEFELKNRLLAASRFSRIIDSQQVLFSLSQIVGLRDVDTGRHIERVGFFCKLLASELSLNPKFQTIINRTYIDILPMASTLHDVGKVGIGDDLLKKNGRYTPDEYIRMQDHTTLGYEILSNISQKYPNAEVVKMASVIAKSHHEWWNGKGYPEHLVENQIPLCARIVAVADVYDALRSPRVYKTPYTHDQAKAIILEESGTHFDPDIVRCFLKLSSQFEKLYDSIQ